MAVYKATYCYPFLNSIDIRITPTSSVGFPYQYLKCKVDTSNKNITGYQIKIYDSDNNLVFPASAVADHKISPILELPQTLGDNINSGINGTYLHIPFFKNYITSTDQYTGCENAGSYNAIYYKPRFKADYILLSSGSGAENINNWSQSGSTMSYSSWDGVLNGEVVSEGDLILALAANDSKGGLWKVEGNGTLSRFVDPALLQSINYTVLNTNHDLITITKGIYKSRVYKVQNGYIIDTSTVLWCDVQGNDLPLLTVKAGQYKWVITLYQGPSLTGYEAASLMPGYGMLQGSGTWASPYYVNYTTLNSSWFDMILNSGTILGSTAERIQIADDATSNNPILPGNDSTEIVVLQGRYIQLVNSLLANASQIGSRYSIESYDASYGHVYPATGSYTQTTIDSASYCRFYRYSNSETDIKAQDIVVVADNTSRSVVPSGAQTIDGIVVNQGDLVLLLNMTPKSLNGIYLVQADTYWTRGSFTSWGDYIGKVIFVKSGTYAGKNFQSQAQAGGILDIPTSSGGTSGSGTSLYFNEEEPLIIFPNKVTNSISYFAGTATPGSTVDGYTPKNGDTCIGGSTPKLYIYNSGWQAQSGTISTGSLYKVLMGATYGNKIIKIGTTTSAATCDYTPCTAAILHNTITSTYIKPYSGLSTNMILYLLNNKTVTIGGTQQSYIPILGLNTKVWRIIHAALSAPLASISYTDVDVPYHYEIRSFFKDSDENAFSCYCEPYLKSATPDEGQPEITTYQPFRVWNDNSGDYDSFIVGTSQPFYVKSIPYSSTQGIYTRYVNLKGFYYQEQQMSWESYRWVLYDYTGEILQDTGKKYDKSMAVTFYGLSNDSEHANLYYATLYVEDSLGNTLISTTRIYVHPNINTSLGTQFLASYDCDAHAITLYYENNMLFAPSVTIGDKDYIYVIWNVPTIWDNSVSYSNSGAIITGINHNTLPPINNIGLNTSGLSYTSLYGLSYSHYFNMGSESIDSDKHILLLRNNNDVSSGKGQCVFSETFTLGDNYCGRFLTLDLSNSANDKILSIALSIADNFQYNDSGTIAQQNTLNSARNTIRYRIYENDTLFTEGPLKTTSNNNYVFMTVPTTSLFFLQNDPQSSDYELNLGNVYEFLHYTAFGENGATPSVIENKNYYPYYLSVNDNSKALNSKKFFGNMCLISNKFLMHNSGHNTVSVANDLNVDSLSSGAPSFWLEDHPELRMYKSSGKLTAETNLIYGVKQYTYFGDALLSWPTTTEETSSYWNELSGVAPTNNIFNSWDNIINTDYSQYRSGSYVVNGANSNIFVMASYNRHPVQLSNKKFRINIRVHDIDTLCNASTVIWAVSGSVNGNGYNVTTLNATIDGTLMSPAIVFELKEV